LRESAYSKIVFPGRDVCSRPSENTGDIRLSYQNQIHCLDAAKYLTLITLLIFGGLFQIDFSQNLRQFLK